MTTPQRIAKAIAASGLCSRRDAERWIEAGRVTLNGKKITTPAQNVTDEDVVRVDGKELSGKAVTRLWLHHKPKGLLTTHKDPEGRPTVFQALPKELGRVISVGRLDINSEGLLLLTNDGALARHIELPATGWIRTYRVRLYGCPTQEKLDSLKKGVTVDGVKYGPIHAVVENRTGTNGWVIVSLTEGKNREIRKVMEHLGAQVNRLIRTSYGPFALRDLAIGSTNEVPHNKVKKLLSDKTG